MNLQDSILITGGGGLVGKNLCLHLLDCGYQKVVAPTSTECDLRDPVATEALFANVKPSYVFHMAGYVRGLIGNMQNQATAYYDNTLINTYVVEACRRHNVKKIVAMGTVAMYPDPLPRIPLHETDLWQGVPHGSEYGYAMAKRGMLAQLQAYAQNDGLDYSFALSTNLYGSYDRFNTTTGHVIPSLIKKFHDASLNNGTVKVWGDGTGQRDFLYVKDAVAALVILMQRHQGVINLATGITHTIRQAVEILTQLSGISAQQIQWDSKMPNGQTYRSYDVSNLTKLGFTPNYSLADGLAETYAWYATHNQIARVA